MIKLTYKEWVAKYSANPPNHELVSVQEMEADFQKFHGLNLYDEIERINQSEYKLYLQRFEAGNEE